MAGDSTEDDDRIRNLLSRTWRRLGSLKPLRASAAPHPQGPSPDGQTGQSERSGPDGLETQTSASSSQSEDMEGLGLVDADKTVLLRMECMSTKELKVSAQSPELPCVSIRLPAHQ